MDKVNRLERVGMGISLVCAVHCIATPLLVGALPLMGPRLSEAHWLEGLLIGTAAVIGYGTLILSFRRHRRPLPLLAFTLGFVLLILGHTLLPEEAETTLSVAGALTLAGAQLWNRRCPAACCSGVP